MFKKKQTTVAETENVTVEENAGLPEEESKSGRILNMIINVILVAAIILAAVCTYVSFVSSSGNGVPNIFGIRPFSIQTDSMYPTLNAGDLILFVPSFNHKLTATSQTALAFEVYPRRFNPNDTYHL